MTRILVIDYGRKKSDTAGTDVEAEMLVQIVKEK
jgi:hypothetical protein